MSQFTFQQSPEPLPSSHIPEGFRFSAAQAGIKASGKPDFACIHASERASAAAVFTGNLTVAAPILAGRENLRKSKGHVRVVVINAGNANCATGQAGVQGCRDVCAAAAAQFDCDITEVFPSSTGVIGVPFPAGKAIAALPVVAASMGTGTAHVEQFAQAILTTDTRPKIASARLEIEGNAVSILGIAKGAGMIAPQVVPHATMLVYLLTDARLEPDDLQRLLNDAVDDTFNCISIDGDTSTNDTVLLLASGSSGVTVRRSEVDGGYDQFQRALRQVCASLARQIVDDGEGAEHVIELRVERAATRGDAHKVARTIANSPLVKTAFAGCDPNWGRILAATGRSGVALDPAKVSIWIGGLPVCRHGQTAPEFDRDAVHRKMLERNVSVRVDLNLGSEKCVFLTCDLTTEYIHVNADYST